MTANDRPGRGAFRGVEAVRVAPGRGSAPPEAHPPRADTAGRLDKAGVARHTARIRFDPFRDSVMSDQNSATFERIADIIAETANVPREKIQPGAHVINDLGIDSLDFLDIVFGIDKAFGIKVPVEAWTEEVNGGKAPPERYFIMGSLAERIDELVAAKG